MVVRTSAALSADNSTKALLAASQTFTGEWEINTNEQALVNTYADQPGTLTIEIGIETSAGIRSTFSRDTPVYAGVGNFQVLTIGAGRAFRVIYANGETDQGEFGIHISYGSNLLPASASDDNEVLTTVTERERDVFVALSRQNVSTDAYGLLIDLSDTTNFPHNRVGRVDLTNVFLGVGRDASGAGFVRIGVITRIDGTDADVTYVQGVTFEKSAERSIIRDRKLSPSQLKLGVIDGALTRVLSGFSETGVTAINTGVTMDSPLGSATVTPAVGDVIVAYGRTAGSYNASVSVTYHGERSA